MEGRTGIDERSWSLAGDNENYVYLCFTDGEKLLVRRYEHEEEMTDCIVVMLFELVITLIGIKFMHTEKGIFYFSSTWERRKRAAYLGKNKEHRKRTPVCQPL